MQIVARPLNVKVRPYEVRLPNEFENAFSTMVERPVDATVVTEADPMFAGNLTVRRLRFLQKSTSFQLAAVRTPRKPAA
jgi:hypothetical protein